MVAAPGNTEEANGFITRHRISSLVRQVKAHPHEVLIEGVCRCRPFSVYQFSRDRVHDRQPSGSGGAHASGARA